MGKMPEENFDSHSATRMQNVVQQMNRSARCRCCLWMVALWCAATVIFMLAGYDTVVHSVAVDQMVLRQGGQKYESWIDTPVPVYYRVHVFNLTNPSQFMAGERPRVQELGPYVYLMKESKEEIAFHKNGSVTYRSRPMYFFQPHMSTGAEEDVIISVNIPFVNAADAVKDQGFLRMIIQVAKKIHGFQTVRKLTVGELLWGHKSRVMDWARTLQELPYPHQLFGLLVGFNDSVQEPYTMHTGKGNAAMMNQILAWNGRQTLDFWSGDQCNEIRGTDANGFAPGVSKKDKLYIFNGQLCRAIPLVYNETVTQSGIAAFRFVPPDDVFSYGINHPENACFCSEGGCPPSGILDMKPCYWGASVGFSFPHFYKADPKLRHIVLGLRPDPEKHRTEFDIYPDLGVPLRVKLRMQMNVMLDRSQALERARHFDVVLPIFWFEVGVDSLPGEVVGLLKLAQNLPPVVKTTSVTLCTALTLIFLILLLAQTVAAWCGWGSAGSRKRPHTPDDLPHHTHFRPTSPLWEYDELHKPPRRGDSVASSASYKGSLTLPQPGVDMPIIDDHTLLPPYRRCHNLDIPDTVVRPNSVANESIDTDQVPPPYSPGPVQRTPSMVSVEIHITASDDELPDLPSNPAKMDIPLDQCPPAYEATAQLPPVEDEVEVEESERATPSTLQPIPGEPVVAPLARVEEDSLDMEENCESSYPSLPPEYSPRYSKSPGGSHQSSRTITPLATSSPQGSDGVNNSNLPPPLESDL
nr:scavenger receptor class B member 1-like isoform X2 [Procambarus clarkii]